MIDPLPTDIGRAVIYTDEAGDEPGVIVHWTIEWVYVRYASGLEMATKREDLRLADGQ